MSRSLGFLILPRKSRVFSTENSVVGDISKWRRTLVEEMGFFQRLFESFQVVLCCRVCQVHNHFRILDCLINLTMSSGFFLLIT